MALEHLSVSVRAALESAYRIGKPYREGFEAAQRGESRFANPYTNVNNEFYLWATGWTDAVIQLHARKP